MIHKILIANRGEIACRVIRTARKLGYRTVAVYSEADARAPHVDLADEAVCIGGAPASESYLRGERLIEVAKQTGANAIHPGYGFLSENAGFAQACADAGVIFIGPPPEAIRVMGDKAGAKARMIEAKVPTAPGYLGEDQSDERLLDEAERLGYPLLVKAVSGGGGRGMRLVHQRGELAQAIVSARREAQSAFGDGTLMLERLILNGRHIEIQVFADAHGNAVYVGERDCTSQRRRQKVIEEAPSPVVSPEMRANMGKDAVAAALAVGYRGAGTIEFIVDDKLNYYFLEMNTRLQVEHPVTECITGLDLVELMIRVAAGEKLPITQADVKRQGWAIECRINAEDPFRNFLPSTGRLVRFQPPPESMFASDTQRLQGVRVDTGVTEGGEIPMYYDSMIAKLIVHGKDRNDAIAKMREALNGFVIRGISSNIPFQAALLAHPKFVSGQFNTGFIAEHYAKGFRAEDVPHDDPDFLVALAAFVRRKSRERAAALSGQLPGYDVQIGQDYTVVVLGAQGNNRHVQAHVDEFRGKSGVAAIRVGDKTYDIVSHSRLNDVKITGTVNGKPFVAQVERGTVKNPLALQVQHNGTRIEALVMSPRMAELHQLMPYKAPPDMSRFVLSPMPGLLVDVSVQPGQKVQAGERVAVIEAMKMENILFAAQDGVVKKVVASKGESLTVDQMIVEFE